MGEAIPPSAATVIAEDKAYLSFPAIARAGNRLVVIFRQGKGNPTDLDARILWIYSEDNGRTWSDPEVWVDMPSGDCRNCGGGTLSDGIASFVYDVDYEDNIRGRQTFFRETIDGITWDESVRLHADWPDYKHTSVVNRAVELDKEYVRQWLLANKNEDGIPSRLPPEVIEETTRRYLDIFERIVGEPLALGNASPSRRLGRGLVLEGLMKPGFVAIVMGSTADLPFCEKIKAALDPYPVFTELRVISAHKNGEDILDLAREYNGSMEPGAVIAVAGRSNGLGGALAANLNIPVISCPPFSDRSDLQVNVASSLMMPSKTPAATVLDPGNAAALALRCLNLPDLSVDFDQEIDAVKAGQRAADAEVRGR